MSRLAPVMVAVTAAGLVAGACAKDRDPGPAAAANADCDRLGERSSMQVMAMMPPGTFERGVNRAEEPRTEQLAMAEQVGRVIAARCKADRWSATTVACALTAPDPAKACFGKLTVDQLQKLQFGVQASFATGAGSMTR